MTAPWPPGVRQLLAGPVDSIEKLECLLVTWRDADAIHTVVQVAERLRLPPETAGVALAELAAAGLLDVAATGYGFAGASSKHHAAASALCRTYELDRLMVLKEMTALAMDRIRNSAARAFSDAFRIRRRDHKKGGSDA